MLFWIAVGFMISGTHGTFIRNKKSILSSGFRLPQKPGMYGTAIYFWRDKNCSYELAVAWLRQQYDWQKNRRGYKPESSGVVFFAEFPFSDDSDEFIDLNYELISEVENFSFENNLPIEKAYDLYLSKLEEKTGVQIVALQGTCPPPKKDYFVGLKNKKSNIAFTIAVMNTKCIEIRKHEDFKI
jgi:hypothetical protein